MSAKDNMGSDIADTEAGEMKTVRDSCEYVRNFISCVKESGYEELPEDAKDMIQEVGNLLINLSLKEEKDGTPATEVKNEPVISKESGAIRKTHKQKKSAYVDSSDVQDHLPGRSTRRDSDTSDSTKSETVLPSKKKKEIISSRGRNSIKKKSSRPAPKKRAETSSSSSAETDDYEANTSSNGYDSDEVAKSSRSKKSRKSSKDRLLAALCDRFDNRKVPDLDMYDMSAGEYLSDYLVRFERYCKENIRGGSVFWISELEKHLDGKTLEAFLSLKDRKDTYKTLKTKMVQWDADTKYQRKRKAKTKFAKMKLKEDEDLYIYSNRVEKQFKLAFPKHNVEKSSTLRDLFFQTVPKSFRRILESQMLTSEIAGKVMKWSAIQKIARLKDVKGLSRKSVSSDESDKEIVINYQQQDSQRGYQQPNDRNRGNFHAKPNYSKFHQNSSYDSRYVNRKEEFQPQHNRYKNSNQEFRRHDNSYRPNHFERGKNIINFDTNNAPIILSCNYCKKMGHTFENCRRRNNLCFTCAKPGHMSKDCRYAEQNYRTRSTSRQPVQDREHWKKGGFQPQGDDVRNQMPKNNSGN